MITEQEIDKVFDQYTEAFNELCAAEDKLEQMHVDIDEFKEGTSKHIAAIVAAKEFERTTVYPLQRALRLAGVEVDRLKQKILFTEASALELSSHGVAQRK
jgi:hypothetical protein